MIAPPAENTLRLSASQYIDLGLCALPANKATKFPTLDTWKEYQTTLPDNVWSPGATAVCVLTGAISGGLELIDFDYGGELFEPWLALVNEAQPGLADRLLIERSQSGGRHAVYRSDAAIPASDWLAKRSIVLPDETPIVICGKSHTPRRIGDEYRVTFKLIETRGEGGLFLCAPTPGYEIEQGSFDSLPVLTADERNLLIDAARSLNEVFEPAYVPRPAQPTDQHGDRPGDDFNARGDVRSLLQKHGWRWVKNVGENEHWRRPDKTRGTSATLKGKSFYPFSTNAEPFEANRSYAPFSVYALLEHNGDYAAAASALRAQGYGGERQTDHGVDLSAILNPPPALVMAPPTIDYGAESADLDEYQHLIALANSIAQQVKAKTPAEDITGMVASYGESRREFFQSKGPKTIEELMAKYKEQRPPVIHGLLREGETMNIIAAPKMGKSWLVYDLALSVATGGKWLGD